jgi:hypothetical protein
MALLNEFNKKWARKMTGVRGVGDSYAHVAVQVDGRL